MSRPEATAPSVSTVPCFFGQGWAVRSLQAMLVCWYRYAMSPPADALAVLPLTLLVAKRWAKRCGRVAAARAVSTAVMAQYRNLLA